MLPYELMEKGRVTGVKENAARQRNNGSGGAGGVGKIYQRRMYVCRQIH